ncbi:MAG: hypothetical protein O3B64_02800 [bacterium]|nr:hypothetical protein [bacterium]
MKTTAQHTKEMLMQDAVAYEAMQRGILNYSKYASGIIKSLEEKMLKPVSVGSVVVALGRIQKCIDKSPLSQSLAVDDIFTQRSLQKLVFTDNASTMSQLASLAKEAWSNGHLFIVSQNMKESAVITKDLYAGKAKKQLSESLLFNQKNLVCVTVRLNKESIVTPGVFYSLLKPLMPGRVNVIEVVTGLGEISLIIDAKYEEKVMRSFMPVSTKF